jgi:nitrite reductase/ring-hydroxylating ferredoxin subunit
MAANTIEQALDHEAARGEPPAGFPALPEIPGGRYTRQDFYDLEFQRVWGGSWVCAGRETDVLEPGQYKVFSKLGAPMLLVRGRDRVLRAFYNTCRHRGAPVVRDAFGRTSLLRCGYHHWTYSLDGQLLGVPEEREFGCLDKSKRGLKSIRCETFGGLVFLSLNPEVGPLREYLGPLAAELALIGMEKLRTVSEKSYVVRCNWKAAVDAFLEVYHVNAIHPKTVALMIDTDTSLQDLCRNGHTALVTRRILGTGASFAELEGSPAGNVMPEIYRRNSVAFTVFPNLIMPVDPFGFPFMLIWPRGPHECEMEVIFAGKDWGAGDRPAFWETYLTVFEQIFQEDLSNLSGIQDSLRSAAFSGMMLNYTERRIYWFHEEIDRRIGKDGIAPELVVEPLLSDYAGDPQPIARAT